MLNIIDSSLLVGVQPPWQYGFNEIHRSLRWLQTGTWHSGVQWNMHTDGVRCPTAQITSMFRGGPSWESFQSPLVVMIIINGIARGGSPCALVPSKSATEEWTLLRVTCGMHVLNAPKCVLLGKDFRAWGINLIKGTWQAQILACVIKFWGPLCPNLPVSLGPHCELGAPPHSAVY